LNIELLKKSDETDEEDILDEIESISEAEVVAEMPAQQTETAAPEEPSEEIKEEVTA